MFEAFLITLIVVVGYFVVFFFLLMQSLYDNKIAMVGFVFWCGLGVFFLLYAGMEESKQGPCVEWQTQIMYNAATKTMMPAKFCVQRGEWEE